MDTGSIYKRTHYKNSYLYIIILEYHVFTISNLVLLLGKSNAMVQWKPKIQNVMPYSQSENQKNAVNRKTVSSLRLTIYNLVECFVYVFFVHDVWSLSLFGPGAFFPQEK